MQVFLIRHADAVPESPALIDRHRFLTDAGRAQARAIGDRLRWHDCTPMRIWASPLVRTIQTAELIAHGIHSTVAVEAIPALAPDGDPRAVVAALGRLPPGAITMLVGHGESLSRIASRLTAGAELAELRRAEAVRILDGAARWRFASDADAPEILTRGA